MKNHRLRAGLSLACSAVVIGLTAMSLVVFFLRTGDGNMAVHGTLAFRFFTVDSNILCALTCAGLIPAAVRGLRTGVFFPSRRALIWKYVGAGAVGLTFAVVMVFLGPVFGYGGMFRGMNLYLHLINPLAAMISFLLWERGEPLEKRAVLWADLPMAVYGVVYLLMVIVLRRWPDFYGFNMGGLWYVSFIAVLLGMTAIAALLRLGHNAMNKRETNSTYKE